MAKQAKPKIRTIVKPKTMAFSELKRLAFGNSKELPLDVNMFGTRWHWTGIGWLNEGCATGKEVVIIDDGRPGYQNGK